MAAPQMRRTPSGGKEGWIIEPHDGKGFGKLR